MLHPLQKIFFVGPIQGLPHITNLTPNMDHGYTALYDDAEKFIVLKPKAGTTSGAWRIPVTQVASMQFAPTPAKATVAK